MAGTKAGHCMDLSPWDPIRTQQARRSEDRGQEDMAGDPWHHRSEGHIVEVDHGVQVGSQVKTKGPLARRD